MKKIVVTQTVQLDADEIKLTNYLCQGWSVNALAEDWGKSLNQIKNLKIKLYRKLRVNSVLSLYQLIHDSCPHCGESIQFVPAACIW